MMKQVVVLGAGGFIGNHLVSRLVSEGCQVIGVDLKHPSFNRSAAQTFYRGDLRDERFVKAVLPNDVDEIYQLAADMGGAGYVFAGAHDADILSNSALINLHVARAAVEKNAKILFYASSACVYPASNQADPLHPICAEDSAYPAEPDSEYGWEKLFSERLYFSYKKNYGLNVKVARFHNIYGPLCVWTGGREKSPAALCRKIAKAEAGGEIEIWGDGEQTRSFLYIDDCLDAVERLMRSPFSGPLNIGSEEQIAMNDLSMLIQKIAGKKLRHRHVAGPVGVRGRNSDNRRVHEQLSWRPKVSLAEGMSRLYPWIEKQVAGIEKLAE